jgi:integrase
MEKKRGYKRSNIPNLYVDQRTGIYTVRTKSGGKTLWRSLETTSYSVAKLRAPKKLMDLQKGRLSDYAVTKGIATFGDLAQTFSERVTKDTRLKESSKKYRINTVNAILRTRPDWKEKSIRDIKTGDCEQWAHQYAASVSPTRFNNTVDSLRTICGIAIDHGLIAEDPARKISKARIRPKDVALPSAEEFEAILEAIEQGSSWNGGDCADLVRFVAYSGCRISEAANVKRSDIDLVAGTVKIKGDPVTGTKSGYSRVLDLNKPLRELCTRLLADEREPRNLRRRGKNLLLKVSECLRPLAAACRAVGVAKLDHHAMRHYFCTRAIENGIDIPTISRWVGHRDGGGLLMRTYSHLLSKHSKEMADKMKF